MNYPNKIYVFEYDGDSGFVGDRVFYCIVVAASDLETAAAHVKEKIGIEAAHMTCLMGVYPTIYTSNGREPKEVQAKILYNSSKFYNQ